MVQIIKKFQKRPMEGCGHKSGGEEAPESITTETGTKLDSVSYSLGDKDRIRNACLPQLAHLWYGGAHGP